MPFDARVVSVLIASPSDTTTERQAIEEALHAWNADRSREAGVVLLPLKWESGAVPGKGAAQSVINSQLLAYADIVFAVFHSRLGQPTADFASGTLEEIELADAEDKPVHVYFSRANLPHDVDPEQLIALNLAKGRLSSGRLYGEYAEMHELQAKVRSAVERDVHALPARIQVAASASTQLARAEMVARLDSAGPWQSRARLIVTNNGSATARDLVVTFVGSEGRGARGYHLPTLGQEQPVTLPAGQAWAFDLTDLPPSVDPYCRVAFRWTERGEVHKDDHSISFPDSRGYSL